MKSIISEEDTVFDEKSPTLELYGKGQNQIKNAQGVVVLKGI